MAATEQFSLRWNNFHSNLTSGFHDLLKAHDMVDVTLAVEGQFLQAHKIVLSICSPFFKQLFKMNPCKHPVIILKDVNYGNLKDILEFMYLGEVNVLRDNLTAFLRTAELLQVKGLTGDDSSEAPTQNDRNDLANDTDNEEEVQQILNQPEDQKLPTQFEPSQFTSPASVTAIPHAKRSNRLQNNIASKRPKQEQASVNQTSVPNFSKQQISPISEAMDDESTYIEVPNFKMEPTQLSRSSQEDEDLSPKKNSPNNSIESNTSFVIQENSYDNATCKTCGKTMRRSSIRRHVLDVHYPTQQLPCDLCHKLFKTANSLTTHLITIHKHYKNKQL